MTLRRRPKSESEGSTWQIGPSPAVSVRIETADRSFSYLAAELRSWILRAEGDRDVLLLRTGREAFTVRGVGLHLVRDALEQQRLHALRISAGRGERGEDLWVDTIEVTES